MAVTERPARKLTPKGLATRTRIVEVAADLIYRRGVHGTSNELVREVAAVSGSQLNHYFPDTESLVRAVIRFRADRVIRLARAAGPDTFDGLRAWVACYLQREDIWRLGCTFGSLAGEILKTDLAVHDELAAAMDRWQDVFRSGLRRMRDRGALRADADPDRLSHGLMAALQGGMLLAQVAGDNTPLRDALHGALDHIESFAVSPQRTESPSMASQGG